MAYAPKRAANPGALGLTIGLNAAAVLALTAWNPRVLHEFFPPFKTLPIGETKPPPPLPPHEKKAEQKQRSRIDNAGSTLLGTATPEDWTTTEPEFGTTSIDHGEGTTIIIDPPPPPPPQIVKRAAAMATSTAEMQPPYPPALQRAEVQGSVTVRVLIGTDGRPRDIVLVRSDDPGFFAAAKSWGLRHWRFKPASEDGTPVDGWCTLTVKFTMNR